MARHVLLNNVDHKSMRIVTTRSAAYGDNVMYAITFPAEFRNVQACYPIVFQKRSDTGQFQALALFGFEATENLFLGDNGWNATYVPFSVERAPFLIGIAPAAQPGGAPQLMLHVDMDSPRISETDGEPLFREHGGTTDFLDRINGILHGLHQGLSATGPLVDALVANELLESFVLDVDLKDGSHHRLAGFYTVNEDKLRALDGAAVAKLHAAGFLAPIYMVIASMTNFRTLIDARNRRL